jgi:prepilin-type N-terminal cleavage/methylation domain-containing protein
VARHAHIRHRGNDQGFTLVELLVVVTVIPMIIFGLAIGLQSAFSLQASVANRLGDSGDSQIVQSYYQTDVQSAQEVTTTDIYPAEQCGPASATQLLGLEWNVNPSGGFYTVVSYSEVADGSSWKLERYYCNNGFSTTATSKSVISYNLEQPCTATVTTACQEPAAIYPCAYNAAICPGGPASITGTDEAVLASQGWTPSEPVAKIEFSLTEPHATEANGKFNYTLADVPADSAAVQPLGGAAITPSSAAGCNFASPGTGTYASTLCLVDFSGLTGNNLLAAEQGCLEMDVPLPGGATLYFCIGITGTTVEPFALPTWQNGFLGNTCSNSSGGNNCSNGTPFYTGVAGKPALYQTGGGITTVTLSNITVLNAQGVPATGWEAVGADAESTDSGEYIQWTSNTPLTILPNGESYDTPSDPVGNACNSGANLTYNDPVAGSSPTQYLNVYCGGYSTSTVKTGTAMVWAPTPSTFVTQMQGSGLEAMAFGLLLS